MNKKSSARYLASPHMVWTILFILAPIGFVLYYAFSGKDGFTFSNFSSISNYVETFLISILLAFISTLICLVIGYPLAYAISRTKPNTQRVLIMLVMLPMWINFIIRTDSIAILIEKNGIINSILSVFNTSLNMMDTRGAVVLGMVYDFIPYMILPIYSVMTKIDTRLIEASSDLGCNSFKTLTKVIMPLSVSGVISGITMVFVPCISTFYISQRLGGTNTYLIGDEIEARFMSLTKDYNIGASLSLILMLLILVSTLIMNHFSEKEEEGGMIL